VVRQREQGVAISHRHPGSRESKPPTAGFSADVSSSLKWSRMKMVSDENGLG
jgi:hypothetical protein